MGLPAWIFSTDESLNIEISSPSMVTHVLFSSFGSCSIFVTTPSTNATAIIDASENGPRNFSGPSSFEIAIVCLLGCAQLLVCATIVKFLSLTDYAL